MSSKILIIDDELDIVSMVKMRLEANNYTVISAFNGLEGLEKVKNEKPDLIILDIMMPKMDGFTFVQELKKNSEGKKIPIIILSVKDKMQDIFKMEGVQDYVIKPFVAEMLLERIRKYIR